jgi:hypothetical protein
VFYESFNDCKGTGANDGNWGTSVANSTFNADNDGWEADASYGGYQCARFGSSKKSGVATSPAFTLQNDTHVLTFNAAGWGNDATSLQLSVIGDNVSISPSEFTMTSSQWTTFTATISGTGTVRLVFTPVKRFFLDEVLVMDQKVLTGISAAPAAAVQPTRIYTLAGRYCGTDFSTLQHGVYIINGKKVIK